jgi:hypothetical protein
VKPLRWILGAALLCGGAVAAASVGLPYLGDRGLPVQGPTVGEKLGSLRAERAALQARADGEARIDLLRSFRTASLLSDALMVRGEADRERAIERLPVDRQRAFAAADGLNVALKDALAHPGQGARQLVAAALPRAQDALEQLANSDTLPLVLQFTPRFVVPRRATGELTLTPGGAPPVAPNGAAVPLDAGARAAVTEPTVPTVPRYAPAFVAASDDDPPVAVEVVGLRLAPDRDTPPTLAIGSWRGTAVVAPERLRFAVPRGVFATETARTAFVTGVLSIRRESRTASFELLFTVLPDRPGSFALDQKVRTTVPEQRTLVSPELLARGGPGETRWVERCFDPPEGWRFDMSRRRVVVVEKMGSEDDIPDPTANGGSVEFADDGRPGQICVVVTAKPATKTAKTATIGRFEATLERDRTEDVTVQSGVRALDWREAVRVPLDPAAVEWKLYVRLFDEIDREFDGKTAGATPFLRVTPDPEGKALILRADPAETP